MSEIAEILGNNIRSFRKKSGWTQEKLAEKAGISVPFMTQIELARKAASLEVIESIAKALGVSYEQLFKVDVAESKEFSYAMHMFEADLTAAIVGEIHNKFENLKL
ncbi:MAG: helix-turn-helix domain-containing protein [Treponema sp.]|nr:helix-turn-helix domain-containing protein [Treponema sp.]